MKVDHSLFSWTPAYPDWRYNTWLGSTIVYLIYAAGRGIWALVVSMDHICRHFSFFSVFCSFHPGQAGHQCNFSDIHGRHCRRTFAGISKTGTVYTPLLFIALVSVFFSDQAQQDIPEISFICTRDVCSSGSTCMAVSSWALGIVAILFVTECLNHFFVRRNSISSPGLVHLGCSLAARLAWRVFSIHMDGLIRGIR